MKKKILILGLCLILLGGTVAGAVASTGKIDTGNPDDIPKYDLEVSRNDIGGNDYIFDAEKAVDPTIAVGTIKVVGDYMYVFGYYYSGSSSGTISTQSLSGWSKQGTADGWGCAVIDHTKSTYGDPCGNIDGYPVLDFRRAYVNCSKMTALPLIPSTAINTTEMCMYCTSLTAVELTAVKKVGTMAFKGCSSLKKVFIGKSVTTIEAGSTSKAPFYGCSSDCVCYVESASAPSGFASYWNTGFKTVKYNADYAIDYCN